MATMIPASRPQRIAATRIDSMKVTATGGSSWVVASGASLQLLGYTQTYNKPLILSGGPER